MRYILFILFISVLCASCMKSVNNTPGSDSRLSRPYCNDPYAVNYNWDFPGTPDNSICFYPTEVFSPTYSYTDSVYFSDGTFLFTNTYTLHIYTYDKIRLAITGFCGADDSLKLTADRFYRATVDTAFDAGIETGQELCRPVDTVSGNIIQNKVDSSLLQINFTVNSDTGITFHRGTAIKL